MVSWKTLSLLAAALLLAGCTPPRQPESQGNKVEDPAMLTDAEYEPSEQDRRFQQSGEPLPMPQEPYPGLATGQDPPLTMASDNDEKAAEGVAKPGEPSPMPEEPKGQTEKR